MTEAPKYSLDKKLMKSGGSLYVAVPSEVVQQWDLKKGDAVSINVHEGMVQIEPKQPEKTATISPEAVEKYTQTMQGIQVRIIPDRKRNSLRLKFSGHNQEAITLLLNQLYQKLPLFFTLLGLGTVESVDKEAINNPSP
jgi:antitoxin component of MazEF toxin-antitoxin module